MRMALNVAARRYPARDGEIGWTKAYERPMRRFNLDIISVALIALVVAIRFISIVLMSPLD